MGAPTGTVTFLFTDVEGSTRLWEGAPGAMRPALARHDEIIRSAIEGRDGHVFSTGGDGFAAAFARAGDALAAATEAQAGLAAEPWPEGAPVRVRMALHTGEAEERGGDYFGPALNKAARLMALAHGGQVVCSSVTAELLAGAQVIDLGEHRLRDLSAPQRVFQLGAGAFPALRSLDAFPSNLPAQAGAFVGRDAELAEVVGAVERSRVVTLTGVGGVGKTRLALQAAAELLPRFRDGAWLVELAPVVEPEALVEVVARALEVPERQGQPLTASVTDFLRAKRILVLLDNCEHLLDPIADFVASMVSRSPHLAVLATSREGLGVSGERILVVPSLGVPRDDAFPEAISEAPAVRLFVERAQEAKAEFSLTEANAAALAQLVRRLDGIPLAIELAAARVRSLTPAELAERVDERFRLLAGGRRTAVERHQTLRRAIDWSYELLTEAEQLTLNRAAVFATDFGLHSAEAVIPAEGVDRSDVIDVLGRLVDKSLVQAEDRGETTRYRLLETIRQYAQERLEASGEADVLRRQYAEHYTAFAEAAGLGLRGPDEATWTERVEAELDHLRSALAWSVASGQADLALRIVAPLAIQGTRVGYATGSWAAPVVALPEARAHRLYPQVLAWAAWAQSVAGERELAAQTAREALDAAAALNVDERALCRVWAAAGPIAFFSGEFDEATRLAARWGAAARMIGDDFELAQALTLAYGPATALGDEAAAMAYSDEAVAVAKRLGNPTAMCLANLIAGMARVDTDPDLALSFFSRSIEVGEQVGNETGIGFSLVMLSYFHSQRGEWREAALLAARSIHNLYRAGDQQGFSAQLCAAAMQLERVGNYEAAALLFGTTVVASRHKAGIAARVVEELDACEERLRQRLGDRFQECVEAGTSMDLDSLAGFVNETLVKVAESLTNDRRTGSVV